MGKSRVKHICANEFEMLYWPDKKLVIGIDEAGRGPLAGQLVVCGVIFPLDFYSEEIYDSKSISAKKRNELYDLIINQALSYQIEIVSVDDIDKYNIYRATQMTMEKIAKEMNADIVLTDAMPLKDVGKVVHSIIKGDTLSVSIAAASILAKVTRDNMMNEYALKYPLYGFDKHKGYGTKLHIEMIKEHGILEIHRKTYNPVREMLENKLDI